MRGFEQFLSTTADVADRQIPYYHSRAVIGRITKCIARDR